MEQEANHARLEHDLVVQEELEELEEEGVHLAAELTTMPAFQTHDEDEEVAETSWKLPSVPAALARELEAYAAFRTEPLNRVRAGSAVMDITVGNDRAVALRFLGWLLATHAIAPGLGVFGKAELGGWVEGWMKALQAKASSSPAPTT